ncbi:hypothetical protein BV898_04359 [Hypsibius exemplaris]|uniref:A to I editase domain-containing protein n=1 Tax=Hypsibius exemplaris TaxID=2072580 RepID=A0A1W0X2U6_HYPEX|nr:hypothetical protein BV898_04359 [Hypsibius exemplaris]
MAPEDAIPTNGSYRWLGGLSHVNSSQKDNYHSNVVELAAQGRIFYGTGLTVAAAEDQAREKATLFARITNAHRADPRQGEFVELLCGRAPVPDRIYRDSLPAKDQVALANAVFVSDKRMVAIIEPDEDFPRAAVVHTEPKVEKIRSWVAGASDDLKQTMRNIFLPQQEYWDVSDLMASGKACEALGRVLESNKDPTRIKVMTKTLASTGPNSPLFEHRILIFGCELAGYGETLQIAKQSVAASFLHWIRRKTLDLLVEPLKSHGAQQLIPLHRNIPQILSRVVLDKYDALLKLVEADSFMRRTLFSKHIAAVILQEFNDFRVISLAAGGGTILPKAQDISKDSAGFLLKDCHAEMLALRAAKLFLYDQLEIFLSADRKTSLTSIFMLGPNGTIILKHGLALHLYVSEKPCGHPDVLQTDSTTRLSNAGPFVLYEKCCDDDTPARPLASGKRDATLQIMSCCDKLQSKYFLGIQGHLLSLVVLPVYLGVVVIGNGPLGAPPVTAGRTIFGIHAALEAGYPTVLKEKCSVFGYEAVSPVVVAGLAPPMPAKSGEKPAGREMAFCYYADRVSGKSLLEYIDPETGKQLNSSFSLLCKRALFVRFLRLYDCIPEAELPATATMHPRFRGSYLDCKNTAIDYAAQKEFFLELLKQTVPNGQQWVRKNLLSEKFTCVLESKPVNYSVDQSHRPEDMQMGWAIVFTGKCWPFFLEELLTPSSREQIVNKLCLDLARRISPVVSFRVALTFDSCIKSTRFLETQSSTRSSSVSEDESRRRTSIDDEAQGRHQRERRESLDSLLEAEIITRAKSQMAEQPIPQPPRRRSIFEMRGPFGADRFSREYADAMDDMWMAECDQGDAGRAGKGILQGELFQRRVALGQDEFSREYFDSMGDTFVAETDHGDSGFLYNNPHQPTFNRIPEALRRISQTLYRPVKVGSDEFSREYAREAEDMELRVSFSDWKTLSPSHCTKNQQLTPLNEYTYFASGFGKQCSKY